MVEISNDINGWNEIKGSDVLLKVIKYKAPISMSSSSSSSKDDSATGESTSEGSDRGPLVRLDDTILCNITARLICTNNINNNVDKIITPYDAAVTIIDNNNNNNNNSNNNNSNNSSLNDLPIVYDCKSYVVGIGDLYVLPKCCEIAIQSMHAGETSYVISSPEYAFGGNNSTSSGNDSGDKRGNATATDTTDSTTENDSNDTNKNNKEIAYIRKYKNTNTNKKGSATTENDFIYVSTTSIVIFIIEIIQIVADTSRLNPYFSIQKATTRKIIANDIYCNECCTTTLKNNIYIGKTREKCLFLYEKVSKDMKQLLYNGTYFQQVESNHPQRKQVLTLLVDSLNNICALYMSAKRYTIAKNSVCEILNKHDTKNTKALVRYIKCCIYDTSTSTSTNTDPKDNNDTIVQELFTKADTLLSYHNTIELEEIKKLKALYNNKKKLRQQQQ